jgi:hypothetical protein
MPWYFPQAVCTRSKNGLPNYAVMLCTLNKEIIKADFVRKSKSRWIFSLRCNNLTTAAMQCLPWLRIHSSSTKILVFVEAEGSMSYSINLRIKRVHILTTDSKDPLKLFFHLRLRLQLQFLLRRFPIKIFMHFIHRVHLDLNILGDGTLCGSTHPLPHTSS